MEKCICPNCGTAFEWDQVPENGKCYNCGTDLPKGYADVEETKEEVAGVTGEGETVTPQDAIDKVQEIADAGKEQEEVKVPVRDENETEEEKAEATEQ